MVIMLIPMILGLVVNIATLKQIRRSFRRVQTTHTAINSSLGVVTPHSHIRRRNVYFLRHTIFIFIVLLLGVCPIQLLATIDVDFHADILIYRIFTLNIPISLLSITIDLFFLNRTVRIYLKEKIDRLLQNITLNCRAIS